MDEEKKYKRNNLVYTLSRKSLHFVTAYYVLVLLLGLGAIIYYIANLNEALKANMLLSTIISSISVSSMLCGVQYLKLLYKACLDNRIVYPEDKQEIIQYGNVLYFILRPLYAAVFVIIAIVAILSGFIIVSSSADYIINDRFFYLCIIISSFIGYSVGSVLDKFESLSTKRINDILRKEEDK